MSGKQTHGISTSLSAELAATWVYNGKERGDMKEGMGEVTGGGSRGRAEEEGRGARGSREMVKRCGVKVETRQKMGAHQSPWERRPCMGIDASARGE